MCFNLPLACMQVQRGKRPALALPSDGSESAAPVAPAFAQLPQFAAVIQSCWQQQPHRRPNASTVHKQLQALITSALRGPRVDAAHDGFARQATLPTTLSDIT